MKTTSPAPASAQRPLRVLQVIGNASQGGMETYIRNFIARLPSEKFKVTCICPYESAFTTDLRVLGVEAVYVTPIADDPLWRSIQMTAEIIRLHQIDVLHSHMPKAHLLAGISGNLTRKPVVAQVHGMEVTAFEWSISRQTGSTMITNCQQAYAQALGLGALPDRLVHIPNGVDTSLFSSGKDSTAFRELMGIPTAAPLIGFVGRLEHEKGADLFLLIADQLHKNFPEAHFVMAGTGAMHNELLMRSKQLGLDGNLHFAGWCNDTTAIYPALDVMVQTTRSDGTSLVVLEAMASSCPVAALAVGGVPELVESGTTGVLAAPEDWHGLANLIGFMLGDRLKLREMGLAARQRVEKLFELRENVRRTAAVLQHAARGRRNNTTIESLQNGWEPLQTVASA